MSSFDPTPLAGGRNPQGFHEDGLEVGTEDQPDLLEGAEDDSEPDLESVHLADHVPFRTPKPGERLTPEELERDENE